MAEDQATDKPEPKPSRKSAPNARKRSQGLNVKVTAESYAPRATRRWWVGLCHDAPAHVIHAGTVTFVRHTQRWLVVGPGQEEKVRMNGGVVDLTEADEELLAGSLERLGIDVEYGPDGEIRRTRVGRLRDGMVPAAHFVWAVPVETLDATLHAVEDPDSWLPPIGGRMPDPVLARDEESERIAALAAGRAVA